MPPNAVEAAPGTACQPASPVARGPHCCSACQCQAQAARPRRFVSHRVCDTMSGRCDSPLRGALPRRSGRRLATSVLPSGGQGQPRVFDDGPPVLVAIIGEASGRWADANAVLRAAFERAGVRVAGPPPTMEGLRFWVLLWSRPGTSWCRWRTRSPKQCSRLASSPKEGSGTSR